MNTNEITVIEPQTQIAPATDFKAVASEWLKSQGCRLPEKHMAQFLEMAQAFGLNPFKREIYAVGYGENWNILVGYEVYLKRSERIGKLDGWETSYSGSGNDLSCTVTIYRKDWSHPFKHTVFYRECVNKNRDGKPNAVWSKMPTFMTKKVAVAQAFRLCFPDEFGGMPYTSDEISAPEVEAPSQTAPRNVTPEKKPLYTMEQAAEIGRLLGDPMFSEEDKNYYRNLIKTQGGEICLKEVKTDLANRQRAFAEETKEN